MTVVLARKLLDGSVEMCADSGLWNGNGYCGNFLHGEKLLDLKTCLVGFSGGVNDIMVLRKAILDVPSDDGEDSEDWTAELLARFFDETTFPDECDFSSVDILVAEPQRGEKAAGLYEVTVTGACREVDQSGCAHIGNCEIAFGALLAVGPGCPMWVALVHQGLHGDWCRRPYITKRLNARTEKCSSPETPASDAPSPPASNASPEPPDWLG